MQEFELRPDQIEDVQWLFDRRRAILGNAPGVGKTAVALIAAQLFVQKDKFDFQSEEKCDFRQPLIIAVVPTSLKGNWKDEAEKWTPIFRTQILKNAREKIRPDTHLAITTFDGFPKIYPTLDRTVDVLLIDEAQKLKTPGRKYVEILKLAKSIPRVWALSGTILPNNIAEIYLWANFCLGGTLKTYWDFARTYGYVRDGQWGLVAHGTRASNLQYLLDLLKPILKRRTLEEVIKDLPESQDIVIKLEPTKEVQSILERGEEARELARQVMDGKKLTKEERAQMEYMSSLRSELGPHKARACAEFINNLLEQKEAVIIGAHHQSTINAIVESVQGPTAAINGAVPIDHRQQIVRDFQSGKYDSLALGLKSGGVGYTLHRARIAVALELTYTPTDLEQFLKRIMRTGQKRGCVNYFMVYPDSFDEDVYTTNIRKAAELRKFWSAFEVGVAPEEPNPFEEETVWDSV